MNKKISSSSSSSTYHLPNKIKKTAVATIKKPIPLKKDQSYAQKNSIKKQVTLKPVNETSSRCNTTTTTTRLTTAKLLQKEKSANEMKSKQETLTQVREKQSPERLQKIINHKDQIIANKNLRINQLETEANALKSQISKYKLQIQKLNKALEDNKNSKYSSAYRLLTEYLNRNEGDEDPEADANKNDYLDPDTMTYEELLELENKIGYVSKGLKKEAIDAIPTMIFTKEEHTGKEEDIKCLICQYDFDEGNTLRIIKCNHLFHKECIDKWLNDEKRCPNCKSEV